MRHSLHWTYTMTPGWTTSILPTTNLLQLPLTKVVQDSSLIVHSLILQSSLPAGWTLLLYCIGTHARLSDATYSVVQSSIAS